MANGQRPTDILKGEHKDVLQKLDTLEDIINRLSQKEAIASRLKELASFFKTDFWTHFAKEEEALFPELEKFIPRESGPIGVMLVEHDDLRNTNTQFQRGIEEYLGSSNGSQIAPTIQKHVNHFIGVLRAHIDKEDHILFMMADMHLDKTQIDRVLRLFDQIETSAGKGNAS
ncbi:MAG: hemerythrin domain-containing protein [Chloroflexi bacterium]|nr:hemerythrin domain-containing protein [Chloroflexota bacterium]